MFIQRVIFLSGGEESQFSASEGRGLRAKREESSTSWQPGGENCSSVW